MRVILAVEDKDYGEAIVDFVTAQPWSDETKFEFLHVIDDGGRAAVVAAEYCEHCTKLVEADKHAKSDFMLELELRLLRKMPQASTEIKVVYGKPKEEIVNEVEKTQAELLIVGSHGLTGFTRFLLGSVSTAVLSAAPCSVLIVKLPKGEELGPKEADSTTQSAVAAEK